MRSRRGKIKGESISEVVEDEAVKPRSSYRSYDDFKAEKGHNSLHGPVGRSWSSSMPSGSSGFQIEIVADDTALQAGIERIDSALGKWGIPVRICPAMPDDKILIVNSAKLPLTDDAGVVIGRVDRIETDHMGIRVHGVITETHRDRSTVYGMAVIQQAWRELVCFIVGHRESDGCSRCGGDVIIDKLDRLGASIDLSYS